MAKKSPELPRSADVDFRHLPPRVTPEEMVEVKPVVHAVAEPVIDNQTEWMIRHGGAG
jgi:hypothetical protein